MTGRLELLALDDFPRVEPGADLAFLIGQALSDNGISLARGDVLILAQKIVSKAEGRYVRLADVVPGSEAIELAARADKDPRLMELVLRESRRVVRVRPGVVIVEHRNGYIHANAGIDSSNIRNSADDPRVLLLPEDPDRSAARLATELGRSSGIVPQLLISDSAGRPWRMGTVGIAIGSYGLATLDNRVGDVDLFGNTLRVTEAATADQLAAAASLLMGEADEGRPVVVARGLQLAASSAGSRPLLRPAEQDMFR